MAQATTLNFSHNKKLSRLGSNPVKLLPTLLAYGHRQKVPFALRTDLVTNAVKNLEFARHHHR